MEDFVKKYGTPVEYKVKDPKLGCKHYMRRCKLKCPTCSKFYTCRICHDAVENGDDFHDEWLAKVDKGKDIGPHKMDRYKVSEVKCMNCDFV